MENWKDIIGYEGVYQISNLGRVKRLAGKFIWRYTKKEKIEITNNVKLKIKKIC